MFDEYIKTWYIFIVLIRENRGVANSDGILGIERICRILGRDRVYDWEFASVIWGTPICKAYPVHYSNTTLRRCAEQNATGTNDWYLGFLFGMPLAKQYEILHYNPNRSVRFQNALPLLDEEWANKELTEFSRGFYLIDFKKRYLAKSWDEQERLIREYGERFLRAPEEMVLETAIGFQYMNGKRLLKDGTHWGRISSFEECRVTVGENTRGILTVDEYPEKQEGNKKIGVCVMRLWDV